jgi:hypothetical protein
VRGEIGEKRFPLGLYNSLNWLPASLTNSPQPCELSPTYRAIVGLRIARFRIAIGADLDTVDTKRSPADHDLLPQRFAPANDLLPQRSVNAICQRNDLSTQSVNAICQRNDLSPQRFAPANDLSPQRPVTATICYGDDLSTQHLAKCEKLCRNSTLQTKRFEKWS